VLAALLGAAEAVRVSSFARLLFGVVEVLFDALALALTHALDATVLHLLVERSLLGVERVKEFL